MKTRDKEISPTPPIRLSMLSPLLPTGLAITWSLLSLGSPVINKRKRIGGDPKERQVMACTRIRELMKINESSKVSSQSNLGTPINLSMSSQDRRVHEVTSPASGHNIATDPRGNSMAGGFIPLHLVTQQIIIYLKYKRVLDY